MTKPKKNNEGDLGLLGTSGNPGETADSGEGMTVGREGSGHFWKQRETGSTQHLGAYLRTAGTVHAQCLL